MVGGEGVELLSLERLGRRAARIVEVRPAWARWTADLDRRYTIGVEEELMLLRSPDDRLAESSDMVLARLSHDLAEHTFQETHASVLELVTGVHLEVAAAAAELAALRLRLAGELRAIGLRAASAGVYPLAGVSESQNSGGERYRQLAESLRFLARREPTMALHVHVGVPDSGDAIRLFNRVRESVPLLVALSANSPFSQGQDSGFASARTMIFGGFPRTGTPRAFACYADYVGAIDGLISSGAIPDYTFLWWDVRLQPALGTVEVRVMDAQPSVADSAALIALVQSLARLALDGAPRDIPVDPEVLAENRFLAARDGMDAQLIDPAKRKLVAVRTLLEALVDECRPHAAALGCAAELEGVIQLAAANGANRQRRWLSQGGDLPSAVSMLADQYLAPRELAPGRTNRARRVTSRS